VSSSDANAVSFDQLISRFAEQQLERASALLTGSRPADVVSIHETRKAIKRLRAAVKLIQHSLGERYDDWNDRLQAVNRRLAATRDLDACQQTIERLSTNGSGQGRTIPILDRLQTELAIERASAGSQRLHDERTSLADELDAVRGEFQEWHPQRTDFALIRPAVKKMARKARKLIRQLDRAVTVDRMHGLRKVVKRRLYWMEILAPIWSEKDRPEQQSIDELAELLGRHHDLAVLEQHLASSDVARESAADGDVHGVGTKICRHREKLESRCVKRAKKLFDEKPKELTARWEERAEAWQSAAAAPFA
jgi:CHAD domain-containing protein